MRGQEICEVTLPFYLSRKYGNSINLLVYYLTIIKYCDMDLSEHWLVKVQIFWNVRLVLLKDQGFPGYTSWQRLCISELYFTVENGGPENEAMSSSAWRPCWLPQCSTAEGAQCGPSPPTSNLWEHLMLWPSVMLGPSRIPGPTAEGFLFLGTVASFFSFLVPRPGSFLGRLTNDRV
jgi:hypothetical protein